VQAAGAGARRLGARAQQRYVESLKAWHESARAQVPGVAALPDEVFHASVAATNELVIAKLRAGEASALPELEGVFLYVELSLFGFQDTAARVLAAAQSKS